MRRKKHFCDIWKNILLVKVDLCVERLHWAGCEYCEICKRLFTEKCKLGGMTIVWEVQEAFQCKSAKSEAQERQKVELGKSNTLSV